MPPATSTPPIWIIDAARARRCANTPDTLAPVIWVADDATATVGGMP